MWDVSAVHGAGNFSPRSAWAARVGRERRSRRGEFFAALGGGNSPVGRGVLFYCVCPRGKAPTWCNVSCLPRREAPARGKALNLISSCAIAASSLGHTMSLQCEETPSWEMGKKKILTKIDVPPLPVGFLLALLFPSTLSPFPRFSCGRMGQVPRLIQRGRVGDALFGGMHHYGAEG